MVCFFIPKRIRSNGVLKLGINLSAACSYNRISNHQVMKIISLSLILGVSAATLALSQVIPSKAELKAKLTPIQYQVTQESGTEPPFKNEYFDNHKPGIYVSIVSGEPLFSSLDKFESGTGWPSFTKPISAEALKNQKDSTAGMDRMEVRSAKADTHLGHVFDDGPAPTHMRYCINSAALRFIPLEKMAQEGFAELAKSFSPTEKSK
jgi:methionine-R-sulfoxide reductase